MKLEHAANFEWTPHRFSGGRLVLDVCNTVILRHDPSRSLDRLSLAEQLHAFPEAASKMGVENWSLDDLAVGDPGNLIALREAADTHFRRLASNRPDDLKLADLLEQCALSLRCASKLAASTAHSALRLIGEGAKARIKICQFCGWLFHD
ncbi:MAG: CGNR zinc finger domain-containing protein, partial [Notoacmeibacter sp.]